jgi:hypothetical protein
MRHFAPAAAFALALAAVPLTSAAAAPAPGAPTVSDVASFHWSGPLAAPRMLRLAGSNGGITVSAATDGKLDVHAVATDGDASRVRVVAREDAGGVVVCVLYADESPDDCQVSGVNRNHNGGNHHNEPTVALVARIPAGVALNAETLNGAIRAHGASADIHATTLNGDVDVSGGTVTEATTLNGNIDASFASAPTGRATFTTNNGNVKVKLPSGSNADVEVSTMHGEITASFPLAIESTPGGFGPKSAKGKIGSGGAHLQARTINGNVDLRSNG